MVNDTDNDNNRMNDNIMFDNNNNKVLARIQYLSGLFDSKLIVKKVVFREKTNKGGVSLLIQGGD